jgi:hypothetical protein
MQNGVCKTHHCGADTFNGELPPCEAGVLNELDADGDGCAEPFALDGSKCGPGTMTPQNSPMPKLVSDEFHCSSEGEMIVTPVLIQKVQGALKTNTGAALTKWQTILQTLNQGKCVPCGREDQLPCQSMDFGGCFVSEGYLLDPSSVRGPPTSTDTHQ